MSRFSFDFLGEDGAGAGAGSSSASTSFAIPPQHAAGSLGLSCFTFAPCGAQGPRATSRRTLAPGGRKGHRAHRHKVLLPLGEDEPTGRFGFDDTVLSAALCLRPEGPGLCYVDGDWRLLAFDDSSEDEPSDLVFPRDMRPKVTGEQQPEPVHATLSISRSGAPRASTTHTRAPLGRRSDLQRSASIALKREASRDWPLTDALIPAADPTWLEPHSTHPVGQEAPPSSPQAHETAQHGGTEASTQAAEEQAQGDENVDPEAALDLLLRMDHLDMDTFFEGCSSPAHQCHRGPQATWTEIGPGSRGRLGAGMASKGQSKDSRASFRGKKRPLNAFTGSVAMAKQTPTASKLNMARGDGSFQGDKQNPGKRRRRDLRVDTCPSIMARSNPSPRRHTSEAANARVQAMACGSPSFDALVSSEHILPTPLAFPCVLSLRGMLVESSASDTRPKDVLGSAMITETVLAAETSDELLPEDANDLMDALLREESVAPVGLTRSTNEQYLRTVHVVEQESAKTSMAGTGGPHVVTPPAGARKAPAASQSPKDATDIRTRPVETTRSSTSLPVGTSSPAWEVLPPPKLNHSLPLAESNQGGWVASFGPHPSEIL